MLRYVWNEEVHKPRHVPDIQGQPQTSFKIIASAFLNKYDKMLAKQAYESRSLIICELFHSMAAVRSMLRGFNQETVVLDVL